MDRQPYIYTLPEQFIEDLSVPLRWKLYTLINGFWISGKEVFASNEYFAAKLKCTERHIQKCLENLEKMQLLQRVGEGQHRRIIPWGTNSAFVGGRTGSSQRDELSVHHISDSISDNISSEQSSRTYSVVSTSDLDGELGDSKSPRISGDKKKAYDELISWSEKERGFKFPKTTITKQYRAFKLANQNGFTRDQLMEKWEEMSTDKFWQKAGFDWANVVQQLSLKPV